MLQPIQLKQLNWSFKATAALIKKIIPGLVGKTYIIDNNIVIKTAGHFISAVLLVLKHHSLFSFVQLIDIAAEDTPKAKKRFRVNYILSSLLYNTKIIVTTVTDEITYLPSVTTIFSSAGWLERETWDLFGIYFRGNPEMRRILTDYGFSGHPLRKDFPMTGFNEIYYSLDKKRIVTVPVELAQEYRLFTLNKKAFVLFFT